MDRAFAIYADEGKTRATPYNADNAYVRANLVRFHRAYRQIARLLPSGGRVLEAGGSPFYLAYLLSKYRKADVDVLFYARDPHPLRESAKAYYGDGSMTLIFKNLEDRSFQELPSDYDAVIAMESLEHLDYFPFGFLEFVKEHLKVGGIFYVTVPNVARLHNVARLLAGKNIYDAYRPDPSGRHKHEFTMQELRNILVDCLDLSIISADYFCKDKPFLHRLMTLGGLLKARLPYIEIIARKDAESRAADWRNLSRDVYREVASIEV